MSGREAVGAALRRLRKARRVTMASVAEQSGVTSEVNLSRAENGQQWLSADVLFGLGAALGYQRRSDFLAALAEEMRVDEVRQC